MFMHAYVSLLVLSQENLQLSLPFFQIRAHLAVFPLVRFSSKQVINETSVFLKWDEIHNEPSL